MLPTRFMEEITRVIDFSGSIMTTLSKILTFKDDWLYLSDDYKYQVEILNSRLANYQEAGHIYGQRGSNTIMKTLEKAEAQLKRVELRLSSLQNLARASHCCSYIWLWYAKLSIFLCPENVEKILEKANEDIDNILKVLKEEGEILTQLQAVANRKHIVATVDDIDRLYVPIDKPHLAVMKAIENLEGPHLILLHGGVGKGKSTLARSMIQHYGRDEESAGTRSFGNGNKNDNTDGKVFDRVVWVSCGNCSQDDISSKQLEILHDHSPNSLGDPAPKELGDSPPKEAMSPNARISKALQEFFSDKKILVILDDVSDDRFLYEMWKASGGGKGKGVKILITSQWANICATAGLMNASIRIFMEDPTEDEAMKILASLVGLERKCIPVHLQHTAKEMIKLAERNPLALACLASHFAYSEEKEDEQAWQDASRGLQKLLDNPEERIVLPVSLAGKHADPRSLYGAMKTCISSLKTGDAKNILFFMYAFKEESAPELVLRTLHASLKGSKSTFNKSRDELRMRELIKIHRQPQQPTSLSLRSLVKLYMQQTKMVGGNDIKSLIEELVPDLEPTLESSSAEIKQEDELGTAQLEKARVALTLGALYFDLRHAFVKKIVTDAMTQASIIYSNDGINDLRRQAIYPIIELLDMPQHEHWQESDVSSARQVFLTYICKHELDDKSICHLLDLAAFTPAPLATLQAVDQICRIEKVSLLKDNSVSFLKALVHILDLRTGLPTRLVEVASSALKRVCWKATGEKSTSLVGSTPGVLDVLVGLISIPIRCPIVVAENAARGLWNLSYGGGVPNPDADVARLKLLEAKGLLVNLVKCLSENDNRGLQKAAVATLSNLANFHDNSGKLLIANQDGALHSLVKLMSSHEAPSEVREYASSVVRGLATMEDDAVKLRILNEESAAEALVKLLSVHDNPKTQCHAAIALANLASIADGSDKLRILNQEGALHSFVKLISSQETSSDLREYATGAIRNLTQVEDDVVRLRIVNEGKAVESLVKLLSMYDEPKAQAYAAAALWNLAAIADFSVKLRIANVEGAIHSLVKLMSSHETPSDLREYAAGCIRNLATGEDDVLKLQIINEEKALESLVKLLSMHDKPKTQWYAAGALGHLSWSVNTSVKLRIADEEGALHTLVKLMSAHETPGDVKEEATRALRNLAATEDDALKIRIAQEEGAVCGLVKCLDVYHCPVLQQHAGWALCYLGEFGEAKAILKGTEGLLNGLSSLLANGIDADTQFIAACALTLINPTLGKEASLTSSMAYLGRANAFIFMEMFEEALHDLELVGDALQGEDKNITWRCFVKAKLGDLAGALDDANMVVKVSDRDPFALQERGVLKQMLGDLEGALADFNEALKLYNEDYEVLKQRGFVKFLLRDEEGALADAEWALRIKSPRGEKFDYVGVLGATPVEFLGYKL